jgi:hypothetical protein
MTYTYLKERPHYEERYDRNTVERCRWHEQPHQMSDDAEGSSEKFTDQQKQWALDFATEWMLLQIVGERYLERDETINEWMESDRKRDETMERARIPLLRCPLCGRAMECIYKHFNFDIDNTKREWIEFFLACKECKQSKTVFENGMEVPEKHSLCTKCKKVIETTTKKKRGKEYFVDTCKHCGHVEETPMASLEKEDPSQQEIERFEYDKRRFCLTTSQGDRYKRWTEGMKEMNEQKKEQQSNVEYYDKLADIKKLNIAGLEKVLKTAIKKAGYTDLHITMPPPDRQIIVNFSVRDTEEKRESYESEKTLEKLFEKTLEDKNWALMSDGVHSRLGVLSGRIRGYETEEDLQEITKIRIKKQGKRVKL